MSGISPLTFTGVSSFSEDFQTILNRAVNIANIPLLDLQNEQIDLLSKKQLLSEIRHSVEGLASALSGLGAIGQNRALGVASSNSDKVTASLNSATASGTYTISDITSIAKAASELTLTGYADATTAPIADVNLDKKLHFTVGTAEFEIDLSGPGKNSLEGLRDAINDLGAGVSATILNTGTGPTPYYLSITSDSTGNRPIQLLETEGDALTNLLTGDNPGTNASFKLNGVLVDGKKNNVLSDIIPGVTLTLKGTTTGAETIDINLSTSREVFKSGIEDLVEAYNSVRTQVSGQIGEAAGLLSGDYLIRELQHNLRTLTSYEGSGTIKRLADLGIEIDSLGEMSFDSDRFASLPEDSIAAALDFLGSATEGLGGLSAKFEQMSDPITGLIKLQQDQYDAADDRLNTQIVELATRIEYMQVSMSYKLQQADVLLAQLESQQTMLDASIEGLNLVMFGRNDK
jgi:flagellar hook-associated protein 2